MVITCGEMLKNLGCSSFFPVDTYNRGFRSLELSRDLFLFYVPQCRDINGAAAHACWPSPRDETFSVATLDVRFRVSTWTLGKVCRSGGHLHA